MSEEVKAVHTYCVQCSSCCPAIGYVKDGKFIRVAPDHTHPSGGSLCPKGLASPEMVDSPQRLKYPMRRTRPKDSADPGWERISWDEALDLVVSKVSQIRDAYGPEAIAFYRPAKAGSPSTDYEDFVLRLANCLGSPNTLSTGYICQWHRDSGSKYTYGAGIPEPDFERSASIMLWGFNPAHTSNSVYQVLRKAKARGTKLIVVDPRRTQVAEMADLWLPVRPGTDGILALTLLRTLVEERLVDEAFIRDWTNAPFLTRIDTGEMLTVSKLEDQWKQEVDKVNVVLQKDLLEAEDLLAWDVLSQSLVAYRPSGRNFIARIGSAGVVPMEDGVYVEPSLSGSYTLRLADGEMVICQPIWQGLQDILVDFAPAATQTMTGIPAVQIMSAVHLMAGNKPLSYYSYNGVEEHINAMQTNRALCLLYTVTGNLGQSGGNYWRTKVPTNDLTGRNLLPTAQDVKRLGLLEKPIGPAVTRKVVAHDFYTAVLDGQPYPVKAFLSFGGSVLTANPNSGRGAKALVALDFYMQTELFLTPTAAFADVVLPAATFWEGRYVRSGFGMGHPSARGRVQLRECVVPPLHESRPDPEIILDLATRFGFGDSFWQGDLEQALDYYLAPSGFTVTKLSNHPTGIDYPLGQVVTNHTKLDNKTGFLVGFQTPSGRIEVYSSTLARHGYPAFPRAVDLKPFHQTKFVDEFPLIMTNFKLREFCHGQHRAVPSLRRSIPYPYVEINPNTAIENKIQDGQWVRLETHLGSIRLQAKITEVVLPGVVETQHGWWQECDELGLPGFDALDSSGANVNLIISDEHKDPLTGSIPIRSYRCRLTTI